MAKHIRLLAKLVVHAQKDFSSIQIYIVLCTKFVRNANNCNDDTHIQFSSFKNGMKRKMYDIEALCLWFIGKLPSQPSLHNNGNDTYSTFNNVLLSKNHIHVHKYRECILYKPSVYIYIQTRVLFSSDRVASLNVALFCATMLPL